MILPSRSLVELVRIVICSQFYWTELQNWHVREAKLLKRRVDKNHLGLSSKNGEKDFSDDDDVIVTSFI